MSTRRDFLKTGAVAATTLAATTAAIFPDELPLMRSVHAAGMERIRVGMIGCGGRCGGAANEILQAGEDVRLAAMTDAFESRMENKRAWFAENYAEQFEVTDATAFHGTDGYRGVIENSDVVLIACASKFHPYYAREAIRAGKHVFVEKPSAIDPAGIVALREAFDLAEEKNLSMVAGLQSRFENRYRETIEQIHNGLIGDVITMQAMFLRGPYVIAPRLTDRPMTETEFQYWNWYHFRWLSGDDVIQSLVHNMDRVAWILGEQMPKWCFSLAGRSTSFGENYGDMFDHHAVVYEYENGPAVYALCQTRDGCYGNSGDIVRGSKGTCWLDHGSIRDLSGKEIWKFAGQWNNPYLDEQISLAQSIRDGKPINSGYHAVNSTLSGVMGQLASYVGSVVTWEQMESSTFEWEPAWDVASMEMVPPVEPIEDGKAGLDRDYPLPIPGVTRYPGIG